MLHESKYEIPARQEDQDGPRSFEVADVVEQSLDELKAHFSLTQLGHRFLGLDAIFRENMGYNEVRGKTKYVPYVPY